MEIGDIVTIKTKWTKYNDCTGKITNISPNGLYEVKIFGMIDHYPLFKKEHLELVE